MTTPNNFRTGSASTQTIDSCCDWCFHDPDDPTCKPDRFIGVSVCGENENGDAIPGVPIEGRKSCSTTGSYEDTAAEDGICKNGDIDNWSNILDAYMEDPNSFEAGVRDDPLNFIHYDKLQTIKDAFDFNRAAVTSEDPVNYPASISINAPDKCVTMAAEPFLNGKMAADGTGFLLTYEPRVYPAGEVVIDGEVSASVLGGLNEGKVTSTTYGELYVYNLINKGNVFVQNAAFAAVRDVMTDSDIVIEGVTNSAISRVTVSPNSKIEIKYSYGIMDGVSNDGGKIEMSGVRGHAKGIVNKNGGVIDISESDFHAEFTSNFGTINIKNCAGSLKIPKSSKGVINVQDSPGFEVIETALPSACEAQPNKIKCKKAKCTWAKHMGKYECRTPVTKKPTNFPTPKPTKAPTEFSCSNLKSKIQCLGKKYKGLYVDWKSMRRASTDPIPYAKTNKSTNGFFVQCA